MLFRSEMMRTSAKPAALKQVQMELALTAVAKAEGIEVSDEECEAEIARMAEQYKMEADQVKAIVPMDGLKKDLALQKAHKVVMDSAKAGKAKKKAAPKKETKKDDEGEEKPKRTRSK